MRLTLIASVWVTSCVLSALGAGPAHAEDYSFGDHCFYDESFDAKPQYKSLKMEEGLERVYKFAESLGGLTSFNRSQNFPAIKAFLQNLENPTVAEKASLLEAHAYGCYGFQQDFQMVEKLLRELAAENYPVAVLLEMDRKISQKGSLSKRERDSAIKRMADWPRDALRDASEAMINVTYLEHRIDWDAPWNDPNFEDYCAYARQALLSHPRVADAHQARAWCTVQQDRPMALAHQYAHDFLYNLGTPLSTIEMERLLPSDEVEDAKALFPSLMDADEHFSRGELAPPRFNPMPGSTPQVIATGSSFFISDRILLTNEHVINGANKIAIVFGGNEYDAQILLADENIDAAVLEVSGHPKNETLCFDMAGAKAAAVGEEVYAAGFPLSGLLSADPKLTNGIVNSKNGIRGDPKYYQVSAQIQPGNSGGPVFSKQGELIGMATATLRNSDDATFQNVNFALKPSTLQFLVGFLEDTPICEQTFNPVGDGMDRLPNVMALVRNYQ